VGGNRGDVSVSQQKQIWPPSKNTVSNGKSHRAEKETGTVGKKKKRATIPQKSAQELRATKKGKVIKMLSIKAENFEKRRYIINGREVK